MAQTATSMQTASASTANIHDADSSLHSDSRSVLGISDSALRPRQQAAHTNLQRRSASLQSLTSPPSSTPLSIMSFSTDNINSSLTTSARRMSNPYGAARPRSRLSLVSSPLAGPAISSRSPSPTHSNEDEDEEESRKEENANDKGKGKSKVVYRPNRISEVPSLRISAATPDGEELRPALRRPLSTAGSLETTVSSDATSVFPTPRRSSSYGVYGSHNMRRPHSVTFDSNVTITSIEEEPGTSTVSPLSKPKPDALRTSPPPVKLATSRDPTLNWLSASPTPAFTRAALPLQGVVMPVKAPRARKSTMESPSSSQHQVTRKPVPTVDAAMRPSAASSSTSPKGYREAKVEFEKEKKPESAKLKSSRSLPKLQSADRQSSLLSSARIPKIAITRTKSTSASSTKTMTNDSVKNLLAPAKAVERGRSLSFSSRELLSKMKSLASTRNATPAINADLKDPTTKEASSTERILADNAEAPSTKVRINDSDGADIPAAESEPKSVEIANLRNEFRKRSLTISNPAFFSETSSPASDNSTKVSDVVIAPSINAISTSPNLPKVTRDARVNNHQATGETDRKSVGAKPDLSLNVTYNGSFSKSLTHFGSFSLKPSKAKRTLRSSRSLKLLFFSKEDSNNESSKEALALKCGTDPDSAVVEVHVLPTHPSSEFSPDSSTSPSPTSTLYATRELGVRSSGDLDIRSFGKPSQTKTAAKNRTVRGWASKLFSHLR